MVLKTCFDGFESFSMVFNDFYMSFAWMTCGKFHDRFRQWSCSVVFREVVYVFEDQWISSLGELLPVLHGLFCYDLLKKPLKHKYKYPQNPSKRH